MVPTIVSGIVQMVTSLFGLDTTTDDNKVKLAQIQVDAEKLVADQLEAQAATNTAEASSTHMFVAGWRPFVGWVCGSALAYAYIAKPMLDYILSLHGLPVLPNLDLATMMPVLLGMLGLGAMRTVEKTQGIPDSFSEAAVKTVNAIGKGKIVNGVWRQG